MKALQTIVTMLVMVGVVMMSGTASASSLESDVVAYVNIERQAAGLAPVTVAADLQKASAIRAQEASVKFAHQRPDGSSVKTVLNGASYSWFGENLAVSRVMDAQKMVRAWMGSPTHRANILNGHYTQISVSCIQGSDGHYYWAMELSSND